MYRIGELSRLCKLTVKTLRYYDSIGLLVPDKIDPFTGYRYYSAARLADCYRIIALKELGFSLEEIRRHMYASSKDEVITLLDAKTRELEALMSVTKSQLNRLNSIKQIMTEGYKMFDIIIENTEESLKTCDDRVKSTYVRKIFQSKEEAYEEAEKMKNDLSENVRTGRLIIINYETEYREKNFDMAACVEIVGKLPINFPYKEKELKLSGEAASLVCQREELEEAYRAMWSQLNEKNIQITGAFYELYHEGGTVSLRVPVCRLTNEETVGDDPFYELPFEEDTRMIGKWEYLDRFPAEEQFNINSPKDSRRDQIWLKELYFLPRGEGYWIIEGWTKGSFMTRFNCPKHIYRHNFKIREIDGKTLLFAEMKDDYFKISHGGKPEIYVYQKVSDAVYTKNDIGIKDMVDFPYEEDERVLGRWHSVDFVIDVKSFDPLNPKTERKWLMISEIEFLSDGTAIYKYNNGSVRSRTYTKGKLPDKQHLVCSEYEIADINGKEYLFVQWKSGDYVFGGREPCYYVFKRM